MVNEVRFMSAVDEAHVLGMSTNAEPARAAIPCTSTADKAPLIKSPMADTKLPAPSMALPSAMLKRIERAPEDIELIVEAIPDSLTLVLKDSACVPVWSTRKETKSPPTRRVARR